MVLKIDRCLHVEGDYFRGTFLALLSGEPTRYTPCNQYEKSGGRVSYPFQKFSIAFAPEPIISQLADSQPVVFCIPDRPIQLGQNWLFGRPSRTTKSVLEDHSPDIDWRGAPPSEQPLLLRHRHD